MGHPRGAKQPMQRLASHHRLEHTNGRLPLPVLIYRDSGKL